MSIKKKYHFKKCDELCQFVSICEKYDELCQFVFEIFICDSIMIAGGY